MKNANQANLVATPAEVAAPNPAFTLEDLNLIVQFIDAGVGVMKLGGARAAAYLAEKIEAQAKLLRPGQ